jgi:hypothetical protein
LSGFHHAIQAQRQYRRIAGEQRQSLIVRLGDEQSIEGVSVCTAQVAHGGNVTRQDGQQDKALRFELCR